LDCVQAIKEAKRRAAADKGLQTEDIGSVEPALFCVSETSRVISIRPREGRDFGDEQPPRLHVQHDDGSVQTLVVISWARDLIEVELPATRHSGCVGFTYYPRPSIDLTAACGFG